MPSDLTYEQIDDFKIEAEVRENAALIAREIYPINTILFKVKQKIRDALNSTEFLPHIEQEERRLERWLKISLAHVFENNWDNFTIPRMEIRCFVDSIYGLTEVQKEKIIDILRDKEAIYEIIHQRDFCKKNYLIEKYLKDYDNRVDENHLQELEFDFSTQKMESKQNELILQYLQELLVKSIIKNYDESIKQDLEKIGIDFLKKEEIVPKLIILIQEYGKNEEDLQKLRAVLPEAEVVQLLIKQRELETSGIELSKKQINDMLIKHKKFIDKLRKLHEYNAKFINIYQNIVGLSDEIVNDCVKKYKPIFYKKSEVLFEDKWLLFPALDKVPTFDFLAMPELEEIPPIPMNIEVLIRDNNGSNCFGRFGDKVLYSFDNVNNANKVSSLPTGSSGEYIICDAKRQRIKI